MLRVCAHTALFTLTKEHVLMISYCIAYQRGEGKDQFEMIDSVLQMQQNHMSAWHVYSQK